MNSKTLLQVFLSFVIFGSAAMARADGEAPRCYTLEEVNVPDANGNDLSTSWFGVNDRRRFVGNYCIDPNCLPVGPDQQIVGGAIYDDRRGTFETFTVPPPFNWVGQVSINDQGVIAGLALEREGVAGSFLQSEPFIRDRRGNITFWPAPPNGSLDDVFVQDINDRGQVAGFFIDNNFVGHGFIFENGAYTVYDVPGAFVTVLRGINNRGDLVGWYLDAAFNLFASSPSARPRDAPAR